MLSGIHESVILRQLNCNTLTFLPTERNNPFSPEQEPDDLSRAISTVNDQSAIWSSSAEGSFFSIGLQKNIT